MSRRGSYDGVTVPVTVSMTDRFSNPVPDGTTANFQTTLGRHSGDLSNGFDHLRVGRL